MRSRPSTRFATHLRWKLSRITRFPPSRAELSPYFVTFVLYVAKPIFLSGGRPPADIRYASFGLCGQILLILLPVTLALCGTIPIFVCGSAPCSVFLSNFALLRKTIRVEQFLRLEPLNPIGIFFLEEAQFGSAASQGGSA
jgi:hypothetical protein